MSCSQTQNQLSRQVDGTLAGHADEAVGTQVRGCECCGRERGALRLLVSTTQQIAAVEPPVDLRSRIRAATTGRDAQAKLQFGGSLGYQFGVLGET